MLAIVVLQYAKVIKGITLGGIYYGAFEVLGSIFEARNIPKEKRRVPIFDLSSFNALLNWSLAIDRFMGAGDAKPASALAKQDVKPILKDTKGQDIAAAAIKRFAGCLEKFSLAMSTCRGPEIASAAAGLRDAVRECTGRADLVRPLAPLLGKVEAQVQAFTDDEVRDGVQAARWCLKHNLIQQGFTILREAIVNHFVIQAGADRLDPAQRDDVSTAINAGKLPENKWRVSSKPELVRRYLEILDEKPDLGKEFRNLVEYRNDLDHAAYRKCTKKAGGFGPKLGEFIDKVEDILYHE